MLKITTFSGHQWPRWISYPCLTLHLLSYIGIAAVSFCNPMFWVEPWDEYYSGSGKGNNNLPLKILSVIGLVFSLAFILIFLRMHRYLVPQAVFFITLALNICWISLMAYNGYDMGNSFNSDSSFFFHGVETHGASLKTFSAAYSLMTFVVVSGTYLILLSMYVLFHADSTAPGQQNGSREEKNAAVADLPLPEARDMPNSTCIMPAELADHQKSQYSPAMHVPTTGANSYRRTAELEAGIASEKATKSAPRQLVIDGVVFQAME
ncbi:hypothetical protein BCR34DRAFT_102670 [Clohesyomyces aquaticus]|uniref:Uncharacterized protein n=1 Tax=Clohesyomyces aquaticus TaxID=1231657 RepID=A0A1Y1YSU4_9PLEO|nr:hypothetical protein BCR34DRAFT_102670 [Clohesyomyces aquaticus]